MPAYRVNRISFGVTVILSLTALGMVIIGLILPPQPPSRDEGTLAHIFQLSIAALLPVGLLYLATADWRQPWRSVRPLVLPGAAVVLAFVALYYLEHYR